MLAVASVPQQRNNQADVTPESYQRRAVCSRSSINSSREKYSRKTSRVSDESASMSATVLVVENTRLQRRTHAIRGQSGSYFLMEDTRMNLAVQDSMGAQVCSRFYSSATLGRSLACPRSIDRRRDEWWRGCCIHCSSLIGGLERFRRTKTSNPLLRTEDERAHERSRIDATDWTAVSNR